jgi:hypothetical protein
MEDHILPIIPESKLYKKRTILICTLLTGPLVAGFMIAENFKALGEKSSQVRTLIISIIITTGLVISIIGLPQLEKVPNFILPICSTIIASACVQFFQVEKMRLYISNGGTFYGPERAIIASILSLIITIAFAFGVEVVIGLLYQS